MLVRSQLHAPILLQALRMAALRKHVLLLVGLAALAYFTFGDDLAGRDPTVKDVAVFFIGFVSMAIYVVQSFRRTRAALKQRSGAGKG